MPAKKSAFDALGADSDVLYTHNEMLRDLRRIKTSLLNDIANILLDLGTTKRVEEDFPVAAPYFDKVEKKKEESSKPRKCAELIKKVAAEMKKGDGEIAYYKHPV